MVNDQVEAAATSQDAGEGSDGHIKTSAAPESRQQRLSEQAQQCSGHPADAAAAAAPTHTKTSQILARGAPWITQPQAMAAEIGGLMPADDSFTSRHQPVRQPMGAAKQAAGEEVGTGDAALCAHGHVSNTSGVAQPHADGQCAADHTGAAVMVTAGAQLQAAVAGDPTAHPNAKGMSDDDAAQHQAAASGEAVPHRDGTTVSKAAKAQLHAAAAKRAARCALLPSSGRHVTPRDFQLDVYLAPEPQPSMEATAIQGSGMVAEPSLVPETADAAEPEAGPAGNNPQLPEGLQSLQPEAGEHPHHALQHASSPKHGIGEENVEVQHHRTPAGRFPPGSSSLMNGLHQANDVPTRGIATPMEGVLERETPRPAAGPHPPTPSEVDAADLRNEASDAAAPSAPGRATASDSDLLNQQQQQQQIDETAAPQNKILEGSLPAQAASEPVANGTPAGLPRSETGTPMPHFGLLPSLEVSSPQRPFSFRKVAPQFAGTNQK